MKNFSISFSLILFVFLGIGPSLQAQGVDWILHVKGLAGQQLIPTVQNSLAKDQAGNVYMTSAVADSSQLGPFVIHGTPLVPGVFLNAYYLTKIDPNGQALWVKTFTGTGQFTIRDIAIDPQQQVYIIGHITGAVQIDNVDFESNFSAGDMILAKFDKDGKMLWTSLAESQPGFSSSAGASVAIAPSGNIIVAGQVDNHVLFEGVSIDVTYDQLFMASYTPEGNVNWARPYGFINPLQTDSDVGIDANNNIYWVGSTSTSAGSDTTFFDDISFTPYGGSMFIAKFEENGDILWLNHYGEAPESFPDIASHKVAVDPNDQGVVIAGAFTDTVSIGNTILIEPYIFGTHLFVAKFNTNGEVQWVKQSHGTASEVDVYDLDMDSQGNAYIGAGVGSRLGLSPFILGEGNREKSFEINGQTNAVLAKYEANGNLAWLKGISGFELSEFRGVAALDNDRVITSGIFTDIIQFGDSTLQAGPESFSGNTFVAQCNGSLSTFIPLSPRKAAQAFSLYPNPAQNFVWVESLDGKLPLQIKLMDIQGRLLQKIRPASLNQKVFTHMLESGTYIIQYQTSSGLYTQKLVLH